MSVAVSRLVLDEEVTRLWSESEVSAVAGDDVDMPDGGTPGDPGGTVDASALRPDVAALLAGLSAAVDGIVALGARAGTDLDGQEAATVAVALARGISRLGVVEAQMLPVVEADGLWSLTAGSMKAWAIGALDVGAHVAATQVRLGRALRHHLPLTAAAAAAGTISVEHAQVLARSASTTEQRCAVLADPQSPINEAFLVQQAACKPVDAFRRTVAHWAAIADPEADERGYVEACDREHLTVDHTMGGYHVAGWLTVEHGQALVTALEAMTPVPAAGDTRRASQRRAQALYDLCRVVIDKGLAGTGKATRPRITVLVPFDTLQSVADRAQAAEDGRTLPGLLPGMTPQAVLHGPQFEDGTPVPRPLLDKLACDGELNRIIFGPTSEVLDMGRAQRTFTNARRDAIIARDRHCQFPGCTAPPVISECHHVRHWTRDHGDTSVDNGILLCWYHHDVVHRRRIEIHRRADRWVFTDADGREVWDPRVADDDRRT
jgi:hypothetical protein